MVSGSDRMMESGTRRLVLPDTVRAVAPRLLKPGRWIPCGLHCSNAPRDFASINPLVIVPPAWFIFSPKIIARKRFPMVRSEGPGGERVALKNRNRPDGGRFAHRGSTTDFHGTFVGLSHDVGNFLLKQLIDWGDKRQKGIIAH